MGFIIDWLLCSTAFAILVAPIGAPSPVAMGLKIAVSGVLVAIAISFTPGGMAIH